MSRTQGVTIFAVAMLSSAVGVNCGSSKDKKPPPRAEQREIYGNGFIGHLDDIKPWLQTNCDKLGSGFIREDTERGPERPRHGRLVRWICHGPWRQDTFAWDVWIESSDQEPAPVYSVTFEISEPSLRALADRGLPLITPLLLPAERDELSALLARPLSGSPPVRSGGADLSNEVYIDITVSDRDASFALRPSLDMDGNPAPPRNR